MLDFLSNIQLLKFLELFLATFIAVWAAFNLERKKRKEDKLEVALENFIFAQGVLNIQMASIKYISEFIEPNRNAKSRAGLILPMSPPHLELLKLSDLRYLLGKDNALALNIVGIQSKVKRLQEILNHRNTLHYRIQELSKSGDSNTTEYEVKFKNLSDLTDHLFSETDELKVVIPKYFNELQKFGLNTFKNVKSTKVVLPD